jgi:hypothetical protein
MLDIANARYAAAYPRYLAHKRRLIGVYVGWRGESIAAAGLNETTVLDRRNAAERVAKGDVRELFAMLRQVQIRESMKPGWRADRMRTVVIGHSFGGLIAFHGLSPAVLNELTLTKPVPQDSGCGPTVYRPPAISAAGAGATAAPQSAAAQASAIAPVFPDMLVLVNPAFEATRFESLQTQRWLRLSDLSGGPAQGRRRDRRQRSLDRAGLHCRAAGVDRSGGLPARLGRRHCRPGARFEHARHRIHEALRHAPAVPDAQRRRDAQRGGGNDQRRQSGFPARTYAPVWGVRAPPEIVNGHDGFLFAQSVDQKARQEPYLLDWLVNLHTFGPGPASPAVAAAHSCDIR